MTESVKAEYVDISICRLLSGSTYTELPRKFKNSMKGLINIKNHDSKCFVWCHPERITKSDKNMVNDLHYNGIEFPVSKRNYGKIEKKNNICINVFCYEDGLTYPVL